MQRPGSNTGITAAEILQKVPPHSTEAEEALLGGLLLEPATLNVVAEMVHTDDFYHNASRIIFETIVTLFENPKRLMYSHFPTTWNLLDTWRRWVEVATSFAP